MAFQYSTLDLKNFSAGITDSYVDTPTSYSQTIRNANITEFGFLRLRPGIECFFDMYGQTKNDVTGLFEFNGDLYSNRTDQIYKRDTLTTETKVTKPYSDGKVFQYTSLSTLAKSSEHQDQLYVLNTGTSGNQYNYPVRIWNGRVGSGASAPHVDSNAAWVDATSVDAVTERIVEVGLPAIGGTLVANQSGGSGSFNFGYAAHYSYIYKVGNTTHESVGPVTYFNLSGTSADPGSTSVSISGHTALSTSDTQLDTTNIRIKIYRTLNNGSIYYLVHNSTTGASDFQTTGTLTDNISSNEIGDNEKLYTTGGIVDFEKPPKSKYMTIVKDTAYYMNIEDSDGVVKPFRIIQSIPGVPGSVNYTFYEDVDDEITGAGNINGLPIILTKSFIYRLEGKIDATGGGQTRLRVLSERIGCVGGNSVISGDKFLYFAGEMGFYRTDGYKVELLSGSLQNSYKKLVDTQLKRDKISSSYDTRENRVFWAVNENNSSDNDTIWVFHANTGGFTKMDSVIFYPKVVTNYNGALYYGDTDGYLFKSEKEVRNDTIRDMDAVSTTWNSTHIDFEWKSGAIDFGSSGSRKWVKDATITFNSSSNVGLIPFSNNDANLKEDDMKEVRFMNTFYWGDPTFLWGNKNIRFKSRQAKSRTRHFPRKHMRCRRKQLGVKFGKIDAYDSDTYFEGKFKRSDSSGSETSAFISTSKSILNTAMNDRDYYNIANLDSLTTNNGLKYLEIYNNSSATYFSSMSITEIDKFTTNDISITPGDHIRLYPRKQEINSNSASVVINATDLILAQNHDFIDNELVRVSGVLPSGLSVDTNYYIRLDSTTPKDYFGLSTSSGGSLVNIDISSGAGTCTISTSLWPQQSIEGSATLIDLKDTTTHNSVTTDRTLWVVDKKTSGSSNYFLFSNSKPVIVDSSSSSVIDVSNDYISYNNHGFHHNQKVRLFNSSGSGLAPTGLSFNTDYYIKLDKNIEDKNKFKLGATEEDGSVITITALGTETSLVISSHINISSAATAGSKAWVAGIGEWPEASVGSEIAPEDNSAYGEYLTILSRVVDRLGYHTKLNLKGTFSFVSDNLNSFSTNRKWQIKGPLKYQDFELTSASISYAIVDNVGDKYQVEEKGGNA